MELWHALNRGVDKRIIFLDDQDRRRFIHNLFEFNNSTPANHTGRTMADFVNRPSDRKRLVDIHGWCLMDNHYHLLLSECVESGLIQFLRKLNIGYAKYFNERHKRSGTLFQGRTKKILIDNDAHFLHILNYIHLNPLDMLEGATDWRQRKVLDANTAQDHLQNYRWSSYRDYIGKRNFPSILTTSLFQEVFENKYEQQLKEYLNDHEINEVKHLLLEK